jgi:leader peptidase (prepilin peptidase)/N-methyltransferase
MSIIVFIIGMLIGSFLNSFIWRYRKNILDTILNDRSMCTACGHVLEPKDLVPVLSFVLLGGKCRYCGSKISWQYPIVEIAFAVTSMLLYWQLGMTNILLFYVVLLFIMMALLVVDIKEMVLPNKLVLLLTVFAFLGLVGSVAEYDVWANAMLGGLIAFGFFLALWLVTGGRGIGIGDIKLAFPLGFLLGYPDVWYLLFVSYILGALWVLPMLIMGTKKWKSEIAFGPFLIVGFWVVHFLADRMDAWVWMNL